jgi:hypothetical protein
MSCDLFTYTHRVLLLIGITALACHAALPDEQGTEHPTWCTCAGGGVIEQGAVRYEENSHRQIVTRIEVEQQGNQRRCAAIWVEITAIRPNGDPYDFYLQRTRLREQREERCGDAPTSFVRRSKDYQFDFESNSHSIRDLQPVLPDRKEQRAEEARSKSNANLWDVIPSDDWEAKPRTKPAQDTPKPEFRRTAWVITKKEITARLVGLAQGVDGKQTIVALNRTRTVKPGLLGQIEASNGRTAVVRFYNRAESEKFGRRLIGLRRWYDKIGGPYIEAKDDLYSPIRAYDVEVSLDDIVEINDYMDSRKIDRT